MTLKPTPDELLEVIQREEITKKKGKLKIFFGMCAGVGKTYAMLQDAHTKQNEGIQLVIGVLNTHGRKETEEMAKGLPIIPPMRIPYRGAIFEEFDLDAVLTLKPQLVLIDELAHTNVPGSRHRKRWQDVEEILDAGIDVYTTLNVQHIESRKSLIESIAEVPIRETIPDSILERANSIEFIDIPPEELLTRLKEGKVYTGELSQIAISHFFKEDNLTALREIALRFTAEKVEHDLHGLLTLGGRSWKTREKLLVAINENPTSEEMIRASRKRAFEMDAPWICLNVETDKIKTATEQERLKKYLSLARDLGAEVIKIKDIDVAESINKIVKQHDVTQVIIGRSPPSNLFKKFFTKDLVDQLTEANKNIDILILRQNKLQSLYERIFPTLPPKEFVKSKIPSYITAFITIALLTLLGKLMPDALASNVMGYLFLLGIVTLSFFSGLGEILFAALLSAISATFLFTYILTTPQDAIFFAAYFITASVVGTLTARLRKQELNLIKREESLNQMIEIERQMSSSTDLSDLKNRLIPKIISALPGEYEILTKNCWESTLPILQDPHEMAIATWVLQNGKMAGIGTTTLSSAMALYLPIKSHLEVIGVLVYQPALGKIPTQEELDLLENIISRLGFFVEKFTISEKQKEFDLSNQLEKLHQGILHSVTRSFSNPIEKIFDRFYSLQSNVEYTKEIQNLFEQTADSANDLKNIIENIILISELESGRIVFEIENHNIYDLISECRIELFSNIKEHEIVLQFPSRPPLLPFDFRLMKSAIKNILMNAIEHSPEKASIKISLGVQAHSYSISVIDTGPGIDPELIPYIFKKFYQTSPEQSEGLGIGLAIVKSVVDLHDGSIVISENRPVGTIFTIILPF